MPHKSMDLSYWINTFKSIGIGTTGGFIAYKLNMPLPWLLGALFLNFFFSFSKIKLEFSKKLLNPIFLIIGIILGGTFNATLLYKVNFWIYSSITMVLFVIVSTFLVSLYLIKICNFKKITAILAALPGAFMPIISTLDEIKNTEDHKKVIITQATRVIFIVSFVPFFFNFNLGKAKLDTMNKDYFFDFNFLTQIGVLIILSYLFSLLLKKIKIPSPTLLSGMFVSGFFYTTEIISARFPDLGINIIFILLGTALGTRLNGLTIKELFNYLFHGLIISGILISISLFFAYFLSLILGFDFLNAFLSFAPGGIHEMVIISYAYEIDPIFISYHHFFRLIVIVLCLPVIFKVMNK